MYMYATFIHIVRVRYIYTCCTCTLHLYVLYVYATFISDVHVRSLKLYNLWLKERQTRLRRRSRYNCALKAYFFYDFEDES